MAGKFGIAKGFNLRSIMKVLNGKEPLQVFRKHQPNVKILLNLIDSRIKKAEKPKNNLTVCSPPVVHLADWTLLPKYFEAGLESQRDVSSIITRHFIKVSRAFEANVVQIVLELCFFFKRYQYFHFFCFYSCYITELD